MLLDIAQPFVLLLLLAVVVLLIFLARELKKSYVAGIPLVAFLVLIIIHAIKLMSVGSGESELIYQISKCIALDFVFIFITFMTYLWVDAIEAKENNKKSIDDSLDWFWSKV